MPSRACPSGPGATRPSLGRRLGAAIAVVLCVGALSYVALGRAAVAPAFVDPPGEDRFEGTALAVAWQSLPANAALFDIDPGPAGPGARRDSRRHAGTGLREDDIVLGDFDAAGSHLMLTLERGPLPAQRAGLFVDLTRNAAPAGLALLRMGSLEALPTKFGEIEAATAALASRRERACLAFRWRDPDQSLGFKGWLCAAEPAGMRAELVCLLDGLRPSASADRVLRARLAQADQRRSPACRTAMPALASRSTTR